MKKYVRFGVLMDHPSLNPREQEIGFDPDFYLAQYPEVALSGVDPLSHYKSIGWKHGLWPHPYFDTPYYQHRSDHFGGNNVDPLTYYLTTGRSAGDIPYRLFNAPWYLSQNPDVAKAGVDPFTHFITFGDIENRRPGPGVSLLGQVTNIQRVNGLYSGPFDLASTIARTAGLSPFETSRSRLQLDSFRHLVTSSGLFDSEFYNEVYPDVVAAKWDPLEHFLVHGAFEARDPNADFDTLSYLTLHPEAEFFSKAPFEHYLRTKHDFSVLPISDGYMAWLRRYDWLERKDVVEGLGGVAVPTLVIVPDLSPAGYLTNVLSAVGALVYQFHHIYLMEPEPELAQVEILSALANRLTIFKEASDLDVLLSNSTYVCFLFRGSILHRNAASALRTLLSQTMPDFAYSDHDEVDTHGTRGNPRFKPIYSPVYLANTNYIGDVFTVNWAAMPTAAKAEMLAGVETCDPDASVRAIFQWPECRAERLPFLLYSTLIREKKLVLSPVYRLPEKLPRVSIIIPMRDKGSLTRDCIESILSNTDYNTEAYEIVIVNNCSTESESVSFINFADKFITGVRVVEYVERFNYAKLNNYAARTCDMSDILLFLNNDTKILSPDWLRAMVYYASGVGVAAVGCKLLYEDGTVQHGGCLVGGAGGLIEHLRAGTVSTATDAIDDVTREVSAVTGACMAIQRNVFAKLGGFDEVLAVAWNDISLCLAALRAGFRNIYISTALMTHFESKSRGYDDTEEKRATFLREASYTRSLYPEYFQNDPYYSPNLSLESAGRLASPPRISYHTFNLLVCSRKVLMLSVVHNRGYGVPVVMQQHAKRLVEDGWDVYIGGPAGKTELPYKHCRRANLATAKAAAIWALKNKIDLIVVHTPPFFQITQYLPRTLPVIFYDYGEPSHDIFPEPTKSYLKEVSYHKRLSAPLTVQLAAISQAVKNDGYARNAVVVGLGNSHLAVWSDDVEAERAAIRRELGWEGKFVVLNVCRFATTERGYKGVDKYEMIMNEFPYLFPKLASTVTWVLAGAATDVDILYAQNCGFDVRANITDEMLIKLYAGADAYMSFSRWEGYNLGIGQALAMGLPVMASSIEAHREFPISTSNSPLEVAGWLAHQISTMPSSRSATIFDWAESAEGFAKLLDEAIVRHRSRDRYGSRSKPGAKGGQGTRSRRAAKATFP